LIQRILKF